jgi:nitrogen fixation/metabolism regulation signal transduction histidine kinase
MRTHRNFYFNLSWRIALLVATSFAVSVVAFRMLDRETVFTLLVGLLVLIIQIYFLGRYLFRINRILVSFIDSVGSVNATELQMGTSGSFLFALEQRLNQLKNEVTRSRIDQQKQKGMLDIVVDAMDTGLICINEKQEVVISNKAAASLLKDRVVENFSEIERLNPELSRTLKRLSVNSSRMAALPQYKASVRSKNFLLEQQEYTLYSIQNIQREVDTQETESWQKLIRVLTHEIMNSLGPVLSLSRSLRKSVNQPQKILSGLETISNTGEGLIQFIKEYRKLSTLPVPEKKNMAVSTLLNQVKSLFAERFKEGPIHFDVVAPDREMQLFADPHQVEQVLINLIQNAAESIQNFSHGVIRVSASMSGKRIELQIEDNGPGISREISDQIFVPFFSTKPGGTGIGLSLSRQIMNNHDGSIQFTSIVNKKTVFTLTF